NQDHAIEPMPTAVRGADKDVGPGGMADGKEWRRTIGQDDIAHKGFKIEIVVGKIAHIAFAAIRQAAVGQSLPGPVQRRDRKTTRAEIAHGLEIFFNPFRAALENAYRAAASGRR